ncbi:MAG TPA: aminotransferase class I/II-fold pyridoxal phosphate-dependent enzyme, partial [Longimicrobiales bacterium]|nr:aminotransferase class I/II-fold pyridoxal phosphate-dependent enzyme [Longimicrobiales bacterium]
ARAYAGLSTVDFLRWTTYQELTPAAAAALAAPTATLADAEGLPGHALAARLRGAANAAGVTMPGTRAATLSRTAYATLSPYDPGRLPCATDLSDNTGLFGPAPSLRGALDGITDATITRYPSVYATDLKRALADLLGVEPANITTGCGSDDVIDSALRAFCEPGDTLAYAAPTFGMVPVFARMNAVRTLAVPLDTAFELDADALLAARARITYLCRPNNPTGNAFARAATERVCRDAAGAVFIDEAYADFADDDFARVAIASDNTVVLRTLSKAYGMAGLRVGFAVGPAALVAEIEKSRGPYKVNAIAEAAALRVLAQDRAWVAECAAEVRHNRDRLVGELRSRGVSAFDSAANFVLLPVPGTAAAWNRELRARGVAVRPFEQVGSAGECLRVSIGPWPMLQAFLDAFDDVRSTFPAGET